MMKRRTAKTRGKAITTKEQANIFADYKSGMKKCQLVAKYRHCWKAIDRAVNPKKYKAKKPVGRPLLLTDKRFKIIEAKMKAMQEAAGGTYEVPIHAVVKAARVKVSIRSVQRRFAKEGYKFYSLKEKPILTKEDIKDRMQFAKDHLKKGTYFNKKKKGYLMEDNYYSRMNVSNLNQLLTN